MIRATQPCYRVKRRRSLYSADFRAPERLFAELMQVSGRAGRADKPGKVLIQTQLPEHPVFAAVKAQDYAVFAENELNERQMFAMPPFGFQTAVRADAPRVADAMEFLNAAKETIAPLLPESVSQFGAPPSLMVRLPNANVRKFSSNRHLDKICIAP